jgi:hypothetical protein
MILSGLAGSCKELTASLKANMASCGSHSGCKWLNCTQFSGQPQMANLYSTFRPVCFLRRVSLSGKVLNIDEKVLNLVHN